MSLTLSQKIQALYPSLQTLEDWKGIRLQNDGDGDYIVVWEHSILPQPTEEQLNSVDENTYLKNIQQKEAQHQRAAAYSQEADPIAFKMLRGEATKEEWEAKIEEIRQRYPYPS